MDLHIAKWGNSLAVRLPAEIVRRIGLKDGDTVQANLTPDGALTLRSGKFNRAGFADELRQACQDMEMGSSVMEELHGARY